MIDISPTFLLKSSLLGRRLDTRLTIDSEVFTTDDVTRFLREFKGNFLRTTMVKIEASLMGVHDLTDKKTIAELGVDGEYISYGEFNITSFERVVNKKDEADRTEFIAYDNMILTHKPYEELGLVFPLTVFEVLEAIADYMGVELINEEIPNGDKILENDIWIGIPDLMIRNVLDDIAITAGGGGRISNSKLEIAFFEEPIAVTLGNSIHEDIAISLEIGEKIKPINMLNLTREPQHDNIIYPEEWEEIPEDERSEVVIANTQLFYFDRESFAPVIFESLEGMSYYPFEAESYGGLHFEPLDMVWAVDVDNVPHLGVVTENRIILEGGGAKESLKSEIIDELKSEYGKSSDIKREFLNVYLAVDKQEGLIQGLIEEQLANEEKFTKIDADIDGLNVSVGRIDDIENRTSQLEFGLDGLEVSVETSGGSNLIKNSVGFYDSDWSDYHTSVTNTEIKQETISGNAWELDNLLAEQEVSIPNGNYTLSFRYKKLLVPATVKIIVTTNEPNEIELTETSWTNGSFPINVTNNSFKVGIYADNAGSAWLSDLVVAVGELSPVWTPAIGESINGGVKIGGGKVELTSGQSNLMQVIDNTGNRIIDTQTNEVVTEYTVDGVNTKGIKATRGEIARLLIVELSDQTTLTRI